MFQEAKFKDVVKLTVQQIESIKDDEEGAHLLEDVLYEQVLEYIARGGEDAQEVAAAALKARDIEFTRYHA